MAYDYRSFADSILRGESEDINRRISERNQREYESRKAKQAEEQAKKDHEAEKKMNFWGDSGLKSGIEALANSVVGRKLTPTGTETESKNTGKTAADKTAAVETPAKDVKWLELSTADGKVKFGDITPGGYKAISEGKVKDYKPYNAKEKKTIDAYKKHIAAGGQRTSPVTDYKPSAFDMTKSEYERRRRVNPDMPEFGSYEYFKNREQNLRPVLQEIANDADRGDDNARAWAENYGNDPNWASNAPNMQKLGKELYEKFKYQDAVLAEYKNIDAQLRKFEKQGVHYDENLDIDAKSGAAEAKYAKERLKAFTDASANFTNEEMVLGLYGELPDEKQAKYDDVKVVAKQKEVEAAKEKAYNYYEENKDNTYADNPWGWATGNYKIGRIGIKANDAGFASFDAGTSDIEATEVYQALTERIQKHNTEMFNNDTAAKEIVSMLAQFAPQGVDQAVATTVGRVVGFAAGLGSGVGAAATSRYGGAVASAAYMYKQTAGAAFVHLLQETDLSVEDAKMLAQNEALASSAVEFGLEAATSMLWAGVGMATENLTSELGERTLKSLVAKGIPEKGAKIILRVAKNAGKLAVNALGEGMEEWIQDGTSITADRYATEGKSASAFDLLVHTFDLTQYSKDDYDRMNQSFLAGTVIGIGHGGVNATMSLSANKAGSGAVKAISKIAKAVDDTRLGKTLNQYATSGTVVDQYRVKRIITEAIDAAKKSASSSVVKAAKSVESAMAQGKIPSAKAVGTIVKSVILEGSVSVGDVFKDTKYGNTITVVDRDDTHTTVEIDTGSRVGTKTVTNEQAGVLAINEQYEKVETPVTETADAVETPVAAEAVETPVAETVETPVTETVETPVAETVETPVAETVETPVADETPVTDAVEATRPKTINLTQIGNTYAAFGDDAVELADKLGLKVISTTRYGEPTQLVTFPVSSIGRYKNELGNGYIFNRTTTPAAETAAEPVVDSAESTNEIQGGKVPFNTKEGLIEYVKAHTGDKVKVTFGNGASEVRTLDGVSIANLRTKKPDGSVVSAELKGLKYNDTGFSVDYSTGVSVSYDFVNTAENVTEAQENNKEPLKNDSENATIEKEEANSGGELNGKETADMHPTHTGRGVDDERGVSGADANGERVLPTSGAGNRRTQREAAPGGQSIEFTALDVAESDTRAQKAIKSNKRFGFNTVFVDGPISVYDENGELVRHSEHGCYNKLNKTIYINYHTPYSFDDISSHERVHGVKRISRTLYDTLFKAVDKCVDRQAFNECVKSYSKPFEDAHQTKARFGQIVEEILANLSYEIHSDKVPDYVTDVEGVKQAYEDFWNGAKALVSEDVIKETESERSADNVHTGVLDGQNNDTDGGRKSESVQSPEEKGDAGGEGGNTGGGSSVDGNVDVRESEKDKSSEEPVTGRADNDRVGERNDRAGDDRGNDDSDNSGAEAVSNTEPAAKPKNYSMTKEVAEYIDNKAPSKADNLEAIRVLHELENTGKKPTKAQLEALAKYKGWGGLSSAFLSWQIKDLEAVMTEEEIKAARATVEDAYYTPTYVIDGIYKALSRLGFEGGNILEPSMGIGNFFSKMPKKLMGTSKLFGVEIDGVSGRIASFLHPDAEITIDGFQNVAYKDGAFDLVVGNVPFGDVKYNYKGKKYPIHDFFFRKSLDKVADGGLMVFITSTGTLDKADYSLRAELASQADLVAAYRLPASVFNRSAGASVATDIIIMQKRAGGSSNGVSFKNLGNIDGIAVNEYFATHPENILGELTLRTNQFGKPVSTVRATGDVSTMFAKAIQKLPKGLLSEVQTTGTVDVTDYTGATQRYTENGKNVEYVDSTTGEVKTLTGKKATVAKDYIKLRDTYNSLIQASLNGESSSVIEGLRKDLKNEYEAFKKKHGFVTDSKKTLADDVDFVKVSGLEIYDTKTKSYIPSEVFEKDTLTRRKPTKADSALDALGISIGEVGKVDVKLIAQLTGKSEKDVLAELDDKIVLTPDGTYELNEVYLSGNIREKLRQVEGKKGFEKNAEMLKAAMPEDVKAKDITPQFGAPWISPKYVADFLRDTFGLRGTPTVNYDSTTGTWSIQQMWGDTTLMTKKYGTNYVDAMSLAEKAINMRNIVVKNRDGDTLVGETRAAQQKAEDIRNAFEEWCFKDSERRNDLVRIFNEKFNSHKGMDFSALAEHLTFAGLTDTFKLRDYQKRAVARTVFNGNTLLAHGVGTGKTAEMIASAMELKRLGVVKKNLMVVPNHKTADFRNDILKMYPSAKVIVLSKGANAAARQKYFSQVASGDWDICIVPHSSFGLLDVSPETKTAFVQNQIDELEAVLYQAQEDKGKSFDGRFIRQLENQKKKLQAKLEAITEAAKKDKGIVFEELGVDSLFVDEAHNFKSLPFYTKMARVAGVASTESTRAENMFMITDSLNRTGGRVNFATATPIGNSMTEIYNMIRFLRPDILREAGIGSFDAWASMFGSIVNEAEIDPTGRKMRMKERFSKFKNVPQMVEQFRRMADILKTGDVIQELPEVERIDVINETNDLQEEFLDVLDDMVAKIMAGGQKDAKLNMLTVTTAGQMAAIDLRMVHSFFGGKYSQEDLDVAGNRTSKAAERIYDEYKNSADIKGTQFVFCDHGVHDNPDARYNFPVYKDLINKLVAAGIPREEIAVAQDFEDKAELSGKVNTGEIRVLIGSTQVMGEGMNAQERAVALHHLTVPYRPLDIEQREGRIIRFGNINKNVRIYRYIQERSYDSYQWQMLERKANFINQALSNGNATELEEMSEFVLTAREAKAIASGNPLLLEKMDVEDKLGKLKHARNRFNSDKLDMQDRLAKLPTRIDTIRREANALKADADTVAKNASDDFKIKLYGKSFTERAAAAEHLEAVIAKVPKNGSFVKVGEYNGLDLMFSSSIQHGRKFALKGAGTHTIDAGDSALGNLTRITNLANKLADEAKKQETLAEVFESELKTIETEIKAEFPQAKELEELQAKLDEINAKIGADDKDMSTVIVDDSDDADGGSSAFFGMPSKETGSNRTSTLDNEYLELAKDPEKNDAKLREMVYDAAIKSGLKHTGLHGTDAFGFTQFDKKEAYEKLAFFFTNKYRVAKTYSGADGTTRLTSKDARGNYEVALDMKKPLVVDCKGGVWNNISYDIGKQGKVSTNDIVAYAKKNGYDSVMFENLLDPGPMLSAEDEKNIKTSDAERKKWTSTVYAVFESEQIKSLDPVTYDNDGNVIPLSKRFNPKQKDIRYNKETTDQKENLWETEPDADVDTASLESLSALVKDIRDSFGVTVAAGKVTLRGALGIYKNRAEVIRTRIANQLPTIVHELGHHFNKKYKISEDKNIAQARTLVEDDFLARYKPDEVNGEIAAEFVRRYFKNPAEVKRICPDLTESFLASLSKEDLAAVNRIAPKVHAYMSAELGELYEASIIDSKQAKKLNRPDADVVAHEQYTKWIDKFHPIKVLTDFVEQATGSVATGAKNMYKLATNSLNAHSRANYVLEERFVDLNGEEISGAKSLVEALKGVNLSDNKVRKSFDAYIKNKHALEVIDKGKQVYSNERLEDPDNIKKQIRTTEKEHPEFITAAKNLYDYQYNLLTHFAAKSGLMTQQQVDFLNAEYPCYVPFYRFIENKGGVFARRSLANQSSPIMKMKGSGRDTLSPLESIIQNTEKIINASIKHQTMQVLAQYADTVEGIGAFVERVPPDVAANVVDISALKEQFSDQLQQVVKTSEDFFAVTELLDKVFGDTVTSYTPVVNESKKIVAVQQGGERHFYQVHDDALFNAITEISPKELSGALNIAGTVMRKTNALITQLNPLFALTNPLRDIRTAYKLSDIDNPLEFAEAYATAIKELFAKDSDTYKQYKAMGGGHSSYISAELGGITKTLRELDAKDKGLARRAAVAMLHPIHLLTSVSDFTESIPRYMEFKHQLEKTGDVHDAMYAADDITTNFKRQGSGKTAKIANTVFRFNNAALQGLDKSARTFVDASPERRIKVTAKWLLDAVLVSLVLAFINRLNDEEGYENLSAYKKNNFYNISIGDGKFISLPKERENAVLNSLVERICDAIAGEDDAFYDFGGYLASQLLPPMVPSRLNIIHEWANNTVAGGFADIAFNKDFKGDPIESKYERDKPSNERYNEGTSKIAYWLGQTKLAVDLDLSPKKIDHLMSSYLGYGDTAIGSLFPMSDSRRDVTMGLRNRFISDSNYSTDVLNKVYDNRDLTKRDFLYYGTADKAIEYEQNEVMAEYITEMLSAVKAFPEDKQRNGRAYLLQTLNKWDYAVTPSQADMLNRLASEKLNEKVVVTSVPPSKLEWSANGYKYSYQMTPLEYYRYVTDYLAEIETCRTKASAENAGTDEYISALETADTAAKDALNKNYKKKFKDKATKTKK